MIREITEKDTSIILKKAKFFWEEIKGNDLLGDLSLAGFSNFLKISFARDSIVGWIYEENNIQYGAILFQKDFVFLANKTCLSELFWYMSPEKRHTTASYKLIKEAEKYAKNNNIELIMMACMQNPRPERLTEFYNKIGYKGAQYQFFKKIS
jgi:hypothetical protein